MPPPSLTTIGPPPPPSPPPPTTTTETTTTTASRPCRRRLAVCWGRVSRMLSIVPRGATPLPKLEVAMATLAIFNCVLHMTILFPFVPQMLRSFGVSEEDIAWNAGLVSSAYFLGAFVSSNVWGVFSDVFGRRPVIIVCTAFSAVAAISFGCSTSLVWTLVARIATGLSNGVLCTTKAIIGDVTDDSNQSAGMAFYGIGWSLSLTVAPFIGGIFSEPATKYVNVMRLLPECLVQVLRRFPFLLPNLMAAILNVISIFIFICKLKETRMTERRPDEEDESQRPTARHRDGIPPTIKTPLLSNSSRCSRHDGHVADGSAHPGVDDVGSVNDDDVEEEYCRQSCRDLKNDDIENVIGSINYNGINDGIDDGIDDENKEGNDKKSIRLSAFVDKSLRKAREVFNVCVVALIVDNSIFSYALIGTDEITPVWTATSTILGGLNFSTTDIGLLTGSVAPLSFFNNLYVYPWVTNKFGAKTCFLVGAAVAMASLVLLPLAHFIKISASGNALFGFLIPIWQLNRWGAGLGFMSISILTNNCCLKKHLGTVNGMAASCSFLSRILAPIVCGALLSWSSAKKRHFPLDFHLTFYCLAFAVLLSSLVIFFIPNSFERQMVATTITSNGEEGLDSNVTITSNGDRNVTET